MSSTARARSTSPTRTRSNGGTSTRSYGGQLPGLRPRMGQASTWIGPVNVPWSRIDDDDNDKWAAATSRGREPLRPRDRAGAAGTPSRRSSSTRRTVPTAARRSSWTGITEPWRGTSSSASRSSPTSGTVAGAVDAAGARDALLADAPGRGPRRTSRRRLPSSAPCTTRSDPEGLWHTPDREVSTLQQLPAYVQNTALALLRDQDMGRANPSPPRSTPSRNGPRAGFGGQVR